MSLSSTTQCTREVFTFLTGHSPDTWVSKSTLSRWNKEVAELAIIENLPNSTSTFASYGILADESTRGDKKIFLVCVAHWNTIKEEPIITILSMKDLDCCTSTNLECSRNVPDGYLHKWKTFLEFLLNEKLNIEILIMSPDEIFIKELQTARDLLNEQEFLNLADKVQLGIEKAFEAFKSLGGESGPEFAQAVNHIVLSYPLPDEPTTRLKKYVKQLKQNLEEGRSDSFGLFEASEQYEFREQFVAFSKADYTQMQRFPLIYEFVKH
ncbi:816_t:CDS:2 [Entrophospora sp. SA101]|nr:816_t:CDS:2 [Entrophospora sp. SA101]